MIKEKVVTIKWNSKNKKHYENKGYIFTNFGESFDVKIEDLSEGSHAIITRICDNPQCKNKEQMEYRTYLRLYKKNNGKVLCRKCANKARENALYEKYGVTNIFQLSETKEKSIQTRLKKYGKEYYSQTEKYKELYGYGDKNNFWIDGRNSQYIDRNNAQHKAWRKKLLKIYNFKCFICGSENCLECHHIYNFAYNLDIAYDVENGVVLCQKCHQLFHKKFGYDCTYNDFILFMAETCRDYRKDIPFRDKG